MTELFIDGKHRVFIQKWFRINFLAKLKRVNVYGGKIRAGMRTQNGSMFGMNPRILDTEILRQMFAYVGFNNN